MFNKSKEDIILETAVATGDVNFLHTTMNIFGWRKGLFHPFEILPQFYDVICEILEPSESLKLKFESKFISMLLCLVYLHTDADKTTCNIKYINEKPQTIIDNFNSYCEMFGQPEYINKFNHLEPFIKPILIELQIIRSGFGE